MAKLDKTILVCLIIFCQSFNIIWPTKCRIWNVKFSYLHLISHLTVRVESHCLNSCSAASVNIKPAYFDLICHLKYYDIDEQWQTNEAQMNTHTHTHTHTLSSVSDVLSAWHRCGLKMKNALNLIITRLKRTRICVAYINHKFLGGLGRSLGGLKPP